MDRVRTELLPPILLQDLRREARQRALADLAASSSRRRNPPIAAKMSAALILAGCFLQRVGQPLAVHSLVATPLPCGCDA